MNPIQSFDEWLFRAINRNVGRFPLWDRLMKRATQTDTWRVGGTVLAVAMFVFGDNTMWLTILAGVIALTICDVISSYIIKPLVNRPRPTHTMTGVIFLNHPKSRHCFPSNHAANLIAISATIIIRQGWIWGYVLIPVCFLVGLSRVWVGDHYPTDVLAGWVWGFLCSWGTLELMNVIHAF